MNFDITGISYQNVWCHDIITSAAPTSCFSFHNWVIADAHDTFSSDRVTT